MKKIALLILIVLTSVAVDAQDLATFKLYKPAENAEQEINNAIAQAKKEGKNVFIQIGGNWCIWCARFHEFIGSDPEIDSIIKSNYIVYHMNYSKENFNAALLARFGYPQRFGFPVFLVLNSKGELIQTQNSGYLEDGKKSYDRDKVIGFFKDWSPSAFDPKRYNEQ
jgi:thioredoxin-related protein